VLTTRLQSAAEARQRARLATMVTPAARGRKVRLVRLGETPDDLLLVVRATQARPDAAAAAIAADAELSARVYVIDAPGERRDLLYGVSVFTHRSGVALGDVLDRFPAAAGYVEATVGTLRGAGFEVIPTGTNVDHFDIQLVAGIAEHDDPPAAADLLSAAERLMAIAGPVRPNPSYAGGVVDTSEEER
jgi:hypothetical protein